MRHIDGGAKSGSGTIVRCATALASLLGEELHITEVRAKRDKPGLRAQHLKAISACREICGGLVEKAEIGSKEVIYKPGAEIKGGNYVWDIGTAGSTVMLAEAILPVACFANSAMTFRVEGGLFQDFAPSAYHMCYVLLPILARMGVNAEAKMIRPGYVPRGGGIIEVKVKPVADGLEPLRLLKQGRITEIKGIAISSHLSKRRVSHRMAQSCQETLSAEGFEAEIEEVYDTSSIQEGAALALYAKTDTECMIGSDGAGAPGRRSEKIGEHVARSLLEDLRSGATVDRFLADQLIIYAALARGTTEYLIPRMTEHIETNLWLIGEMLGAKSKMEGNRIKIEGVGFKK
jgi:RNA 3'-terminal phosphate cyclase (ATP)